MIRDDRKKHKGLTVKAKPKTDRKKPKKCEIRM